MIPRILSKRDSCGPYNSYIHHPTLHWHLIMSNPDTTEVSVIIVNWNALEELRSCINALLPVCDKLRMEIIVVDNASSDESADTITKEFPDVRVQRNDQNLGFGKACNQGVAVSRGTYLLFLNPDTVPNCKALVRMREFMDTSPDAGCVGCKLVYKNGAVQRSYYAFPSPSNYLAYHSLLSALIYRVSRLFGKRDKPCASSTSGQKTIEVDWLMGACMMLRKSDFDEIGGFDDRFFMYSEDTDLCFRLKEKGKKCFYLPGATIFHLERAASSKRKFFTYREIFRSMKMFYQKHYPEKKLKQLKRLVLLDMSLRGVIYGIVRMLTFDRSEFTREKSRAVRGIKALFKQDASQ